MSIVLESGTRLEAIIPDHSNAGPGPEANSFHTVESEMVGSQNPAIAMTAQYIETKKQEGDRTFITTPNGITTEPPGKKAGYSSNIVVTSHYTWYNFIFLNLFEQMHEPVNMYFFMIGVLQLVKTISATNGWPDMWQTLIFIMGISTVRAGVEDLGKHRGDRERNAALFDVLRAGKWTPTQSGRILTGDICRIKKNQMVPADMLFIGSSHPHGACFLDRANLNGETHLEVYDSVADFKAIFENPESPANYNITLNYEPPNKAFDEFRGQMIMDFGGTKKAIDVDGSILLMRETNLRNTDFIFGLVVYTGNDTKIQRSNNSGQKAKIKKSRVFRMVNTFLIMMFGWQFVMCAFCGIMSGIEWNKARNFWYMHGEDAISPVEEAVLRMFTWLQNFSQMVPISLIMTSEMVKFIQGMFIQWDINLYDGRLNRKSKVNRSTINEDLGLVDYIFSDKTGTLTQNKMEFRFFQGAFGPHGSKETEIARSVRRRQEELKKRGEGVAVPEIPWTALEAPEIAQPAEEYDCCHPKGCCPSLACFWHIPEPEAGDSEPEVLLQKSEFSEEERIALLRGLWGPCQSGESEEQKQIRQAGLRNYMVHMAISSTIKPFNNQQGQLEYQADSAEELAMVKFARTLGFTLLKRSPTILEIEERDEGLVVQKKTQHTYHHLATFGFTSARARVTIIYQVESVIGTEKEIHIMCKGQDTVVCPLLSNQTNSMELEELLSELCNNGLRTLVVAEARRSGAWWAQHAEAIKNLSEARIGRDDRAKQEHALFEMIEKDAKLGYLGVMGLEDRLQLLVPETIKDCIHAGIKVWMITGDKLETARNIGLACNLIDSDMQVVFEPGTDLRGVVENFHASRLIEVTGAWAALVDNKKEMESIFQLIDKNHDGKIAYEEMADVLKMLRPDLKPEVMEQMKSKATDGKLDQNTFCTLMTSSKTSMFEAIECDIKQGWQKYKSIEDKELYPVSLLVNREAFLTLFPDQKEGPKDGVSDEQREKLQDLFFGLAHVSKSVIFARAQPSMKKKMVTEVMKRIPSAVTLAIGDGANDVDMISAANVGVGISGVEGTGAVNSADFAIGTFRMLHTLLFVHGYWSYRRVSYLVNFVCYKALFSIVPCFIYGVHSAYSGERLWDSLTTMCFNLFYTSSIVMAISILDQSLPREVLQNNVAAFREQKNKRFTARLFATWVLRSLVHGIVVYMIIYFAIRDTAITPDGLTADRWYLCVVNILSVTCVVTMISMFDMSLVTALHWLTIVVFSLGSLFVFNWVANKFDSMQIYGQVDVALGSPLFWLMLGLILGVVVILELSLRALKSFMRPSLTTVLQERNLFWTKGEKHSHIIKMTEEQEDQWKNRKTRKKKPTHKDANDLELKDANEDNLKAAIRILLRFRNVTGAQFDAVNNVQHYQTFDSPQKEAKPSATKDPTKQTTVEDKDESKNSDVDDEVRLSA